MIKLDLHVHSKYSPDGTLSPTEIVKVAKKAGMKGVAITDHNCVKGGGVGKKEARDFLVIQGTEVSSAQGHILALGVREDIPKRLSIEETRDRIVALGGIAVPSHPLRAVVGIGKKNLYKGVFEIIEGHNSDSLPHQNQELKRIVKELDLGVTGGSDGHIARHIGDAFTTLEMGMAGEDEVLDAIIKKKTSCGGLSRGYSGHVPYLTYATLKWMWRGGKKM